jgi:hypothetical protein
MTVQRSVQHAISCLNPRPLLASPHHPRVFDNNALRYYDANLRGRVDAMLDDEYMGHGPCAADCYLSRPLGRPKMKKNASHAYQSRTISQPRSDSLLLLAPTVSEVCPHPACTGWLPETQARLPCSTR